MTLIRSIPALMVLEEISIEGAPPAAHWLSSNDAAKLTDTFVYSCKLTSLHWRMSYKFLNSKQIKTNQELLYSTFMLLSPGGSLGAPGCGACICPNVWVSEDVCEPVCTLSARGMQQESQIAAQLIIHAVWVLSFPRLTFFPGHAVNWANRASSWNARTISSAGEGTLHLLAKYSTTLNRLIKL